jgi:hypothetical protein
MDWIAVYAATVSTIVGIMQLHELRQRARTQVQVTIHPLFMGGELAWIGLTVVNHSDHHINLTGLWIVDVSSGERHVAELDVFEAERNAELFDEIGAHDAATGVIPRRALDEMRIAPRSVVAASVETKTGLSFRSKPITL